MKNILIATLALALAAAIPALALAQTSGGPSARLPSTALPSTALPSTALGTGGTGGTGGAGYDLTWYTIDDGGGTAAGVGSPNPYILNGTVGQPDASTWSGGGYVLVGGFWGGEAAQYRVYLPLVMRNP